MVRRLFGIPNPVIRKSQEGCRCLCLAVLSVIATSKSQGDALRMQP